MALLEIVKLSKNFGGLAVLSQVDLQVDQGEILGLIGPNGAGKTTMFNVISGIYQPDQGKIVFKGEDITGVGFNKVAAMGLVRTFQLTSLFMEMTAFDNVMVGHHLHSRSRFWDCLFNTRLMRHDRSDIEQSTMNILESLGLASVRNETAKNLPHGYQRALGVAIALAAKPELLLLDEPVTGMNLAEIEVMLGIIKGIRDKGTTLVLVEHNMRATMDICDRIAVLNFGKKIAEGPPTEISQNERVIEAYLGQGEVT